jgi:hypothetical protein
MTVWSVVHTPAPRHPGTPPVLSLLVSLTKTFI